MEFSSHVSRVLMHGVAHAPSKSCTMIAAKAGSSYISVRMYVMRFVASLQRNRTLMTLFLF
jgi:hypothetical protein